MLIRLGYSVEFADDGLQAIDLYQEARNAGTPFDAVIMDLTIPGGMGGNEALEQLLAIDPKARVLASSGYLNDPVMTEYKKYGFSGAVPKPYRIHDLGKTLHAVMRDKASGTPREH